MNRGKRVEAADITRGKGARHVLRIEKAMETLGDFAQSKAKEFLHSTENSRINAFRVMYFLVSLSVLISVLLAIFITKSITNPVGMLKLATEKTGRGQLDTVIGIE